MGEVDSPERKIESRVVKTADQLRGNNNHQHMRASLDQWPADAPGTGIMSYLPVCNHAGPAGIALNSLAQEQNTVSTSTKINN